MRKKSDKKQELDFDPIFLIASLMLLSLGAVMVYSSSFFVSKEIYASGIFLIKKHLIHLCIGLCIMFSLMSLDYRIFRSKFLGFFALGGGIIALCLCFMPGIGLSGGHAKRWISVFGFTIQSSEIVKISLVFFIAQFLSRRSKSIGDFSEGVLPVLCITSLVALLIFIEPDFGTAAVIIVWSMMVLFVAGMKWRHISVMILAGVPIGFLLLLAAPYRRSRLIAFMNPWDHMQDIGFQIVQSMVGFAKGGILGTGLGEGTQKLFFLPAPHTDFILSVVGEELGLLGVLSVIVLFGIWIWRAFSIALATNDSFGFYLVIAAGSLIGLQVVINAAMSMSLVPTIGLGLPFISYGGSSMITATAASGIILSVSKRARL
ncbi:MAG: putative lipid II flippase FtsW [Deltaproteobacteria bacterium]|nr:putative lipid II flippase FtsW [Deltaproteobacteria bacterium]